MLRNILGVIGLLAVCGGLYLGPTQGQGLIAAACGVVFIAAAAVVHFNGEKPLEQ